MRKKKKTIDASNQLLPKEIQGVKNQLKPKSINQKEYIKTAENNTITFCQGLAGSGKTHIAVGLAVQALLEEKIDRIIITRPVLEAGERLGFLPGTAEEKLHPYLLPILDEINYFINMSTYTKLKLDRKIEIVPLGLMRGRSFHKSFIIADECQNATFDQLKMLLTRIGMNSKMVLTGDIGQSDLNRPMQGGFLSMIDSLKDIEGIGFVELNALDIIRNPIIGKILARLTK